ncbi:MAG: CDP-alcohol phosphatidyltransferase family protein, partial [Gemmatimonadales bacterium]
GVAPAMIMYFLEFSTAGRFAWLICFAYVVTAVLRLARYNVVAHTKPSTGTWFTGLPSPAAGMTLATWYPFSQTEFYRQQIAPLNLAQSGLPVLIILAAVLMVSNVKYPRFPAAGFRSVTGLLGTAFTLVFVIVGLTWPEHFFFPLGLAFMAFGVIRAAILAVLERPDPQPVTPGLLPDDEDDDLDDDRVSARQEHEL